MTCIIVGGVAIAVPLAIEAWRQCQTGSAIRSKLRILFGKD